MLDSFRYLFGLLAISDMKLQYTKTSVTISDIVVRTE